MGTRASFGSLAHAMMEKGNPKRPGGTPERHLRPLSCESQRNERALA
jgi:hypothetical protein